MGITNAALIGYGVAGAKFHAPLVSAEPRLRLATVVTSRADAVAERWPEVRTAAEPGAVWADPSIGLVVVAAPNPLHVPLARAALEAGKHVVVDKPLAPTADEAAELAALATARGRVLTTFHNRRWDADFLTVEALVRSGRLGEVMLAEMCWDRFRPAIKPGWREVPGEGSGLLADLGPHLIDQAIRLFGRPDAVAGDVAVQRGAARVDDWFDVTLHYGRARVRLSASTLVASPRPRFALHGTGGSFVKYGIDPQEPVLRAGGSPDDPGYGEEDPSAWGLFTDADGRSEPVPTLRGDWRRFYAGVADAIAGGPVPVDPADAVLGLRIIGLAREATRTKRSLPLD